MSDTTSTRPVSVITTLFVLALFAVFFLAVRFYYKPTTTAAFVATPDNFSKDLEWKATRESRQKTLADAQKAEAERIGSYSWADQKAGVVRLPIDRAMELTAQQYGKKKQ
jgi:hypothetical protein